MIAFARSRLFLTQALLLAAFALTGGADEPKAWVDGDGVPLPDGVVARVGSARWRASGHAKRAEMSRDGDYLAITDEFGNCGFFDTDTGRRVLEMGPDEGRLVGILPDSCHFVTAKGGIWSEYSLPEGKLVRKDALLPTTSEVGLSPDGRSIVQRLSETEVIYQNRITGKRTFAEEATSTRARRRSPDFQYPNLELHQTEKSATVRDRDTKRVFWQCPNPDSIQPPLLFAASPDKLYFLVGPKDPELRREFPLEIYRTADGKKLCTLENASGEHYDEAAFAPRRYEVYLSGPSGIQVRNAITGVLLRRLAPEGDTAHMFLHPDRETMLLVDDAGRFRRIDLNNGKTVLGATAETGFFGFASETSVVAVREGRVRVVDFRTGKDLEVGRATVPPLSPASPLVLSADRRRMVFAPAEERRDRAEVRAHQLVDYDDRSGTIRTTPTGVQVGSMALAPDGRTLYLGGLKGPSVGIFDLDTAEFSRGPERNPQDRVGEVAVSRSGRLVAWVGQCWFDGGIAPAACVWEPKSLRKTLRLTRSGRSPRSLAFSPDEKYLAVVGGSKKGGEVDVYDLATGKPFASFVGHTGGVKNAAFAADGRSLATASHDGTVRIWETATKSQRLLLPHTPRTHDGLWFSPSGALLATRSASGEVLIHDLYGKQRPTTPALEDAAAADAVRELGSGDASAAFAAMRRLVASPTKAVRALGEAVASAKPPAAKVVDGWLADLESDDAAVLESALANLRQHASELEPRLKNARSATRESDVQDRLDELLKGADRVTPAWLRLLRGIEVLEQIGTPEARRLLESLAEDGDTRRTREAKASLGRLR